MSVGVTGGLHCLSLLNRLCLLQPEKRDGDTSATLGTKEQVDLESSFSLRGTKRGFMCLKPTQT